MSYQVLARKYRPQRFEQLIGHQGARSALVNALKEEKLHHTYLLTGTRGVGKTSLARLFAKCLNCVQKVTPSPCEKCASCIAIQKNQFIDLVEVDAASRTRVEDIQSLLENVQYKPTLGRYKIYLIDEVHMLSLHSFNALLKTLEEPPPHVIFLLATTDRERVPETILSRCLHFHLRPLEIEEITQQLINILKQENVTYDITALQKIAQLAKGSLRDALSLIEPVLLTGTTNQVTLEDVHTTFGYIDKANQWALISAIQQRNTKALLQLIQEISNQSIHFEQILDDLMENFYQIALAQQIKNFETDLVKDIPLEIIGFAKQMPPEQVQLYYQIVLRSKKDLFLAPTPQLCFKMTMLRMVAFTPAIAASKETSPKETIIAIQEDEKPAAVQSLDWSQLVQQLALTGFIQSLALHCALKNSVKNTVHLLLDVKHKALYSVQRKDALQSVLSQHFNKSITLTIEISADPLLTPAMLIAEKKQKDDEKTHQEILNDPNIQSLQKTFDATIKN